MKRKQTAQWHSLILGVEGKMLDRKRKAIQHRITRNRCTC